MAIAPETQSYINRVRAPGVAAGTVKGSIKNTMAAIGNYVGENATQVRLAHDMILGEGNATLRGNVSSDVQALGACRRVLTEIEGNLRELASIVDQLSTSQAVTVATALAAGGV